MDGLSPTKPENTGRLKMSSSRPSQMCYKEKKRRIFFTIGLLRVPEPSSISQILYFPSYFILFYFIFIIIYKLRYLDLFEYLIILSFIYTQFLVLHISGYHNNKFLQGNSKIRTKSFKSRIS